MRWAFWRTRVYDGPLERERPLPTPPPAVRQPAGDVEEEPDDTGARQPPFSGAAPGAAAGDGEGDHAIGVRGHPTAEPPEAGDVAGIRDDVLALVRAALAQERPAADAAVQRLSARGADALDVAALVTVELLADRLLTAAGGLAAPGHATADSDEDVEAALAQGTAVAHRAAPLLRRLVPHAPQQLVRDVVRLAAGAPAGGAPTTAGAAAEQVVLVAAVLLAQTVHDDGGEQELGAQLAELLPNA